MTIPVREIKETKHKYKTFFDPSTIPWTEWVMPGTYFKLLNVNDMSSTFTMLLKVDPGNEAPLHHHLGSVEVYVIEGEFGYGDDRGGAGSYSCESAGAMHSPTSPQGTVMFAVVNGPIVGYADDDSVAVIVDKDLMYQMAEANGAASHIRRIEF